MKTQNDQITDKDFNVMESILLLTIAALEKASTYGKDMKSSRLQLMREATAILAMTLESIDNGGLN